MAQFEFYCDKIRYINNNQLYDYIINDTSKHYNLIKKIINSNNYNLSVGNIQKLTNSLLITISNVDDYANFIVKLVTDNGVKEKYDISTNKILCINKVDHNFTIKCYVSYLQNGSPSNIYYMQEVNITVKYNSEYNNYLIDNRIVLSPYLMYINPLIPEIKFKHIGSELTISYPHFE